LICYKSCQKTNYCLLLVSSFFGLFKSTNLNQLPTSNLKLPVIILFGPPGSGKGTQANLICQKYDLLNLSIGNSVRAFINTHNNSDSIEFERVLRLKQKLENGELQDFNDVKYIVENEIKNTISNHKNILIEGLPRTPEQAEWLKEFFSESGVDCLFYHFLIPKEQVLERLGHRYYVPGDETPYASFDEAKSKCSPDQNPIQRKDDQDINIILNRYNKQYADCQRSIIETISSCQNVQTINLDASPSQQQIFDLLSEDILSHSNKFNAR